MTAHYVYRCFDSEGRLLYVGQTKDAVARLAQHQSRAFWADDVTKVRVKAYPAPQLAREVERAAIRTESPRFNLQGRPPQRTWSREDYSNLLLLFAEGNLVVPTQKWQWRRMRSLLVDYSRAFGEPHPDAPRLELLLEQLAEEFRVAREADERRQAQQHREWLEREEQDRRDHASRCCACMYGIDVGDEVIDQFADEAGKRAWAEMSA